MSGKKTKRGRQTKVEDQPICTISTDLPQPSKALATVIMTVSNLAETEHGLKNGTTALYFHLVHTVQKHLKG